MHVTLRSGFRPLRSPFVFPTIRNAIAALNARRPGDFRVVHFSVQFDHLHLIVEAGDKRALSAGLRGLAVSVARQVNRLVMRHGRLWADRWHGRALHTPRAVRHALVYVLANFAKHARWERRQTRFDHFSSAPYFCDFLECRPRRPLDLDPTLVPKTLAPPADPPVLEPRSWLLRTGYRRRLGPISLADRPALG